MAKLANATKNNDTIITSLKDGAYKQARATEGLESMAQYVLTNCKGFPDEVSKEVVAELNEGYKLRYSERYPKRSFVIVNDHYLLDDGTNPELANVKERKEIGVEFAFSFSQQQFGKLKDEEPYLYPIIKEIRKGFQTYASNRLGDLKRQARKLLPNSNERSASKDFAVWAKEVWLDTFKTRAKNAKSKGDVTVDDEFVSKVERLFKS